MRRAHRTLALAVSCLLGCELAQSGLGDPLDPGIADVGASSDSEDDAEVTEPSCQMDGVRALRIDANVSWGTTAALSWMSGVAPGSGTMSLLALVETEGDTATVRGCDASMPNVSSTAGTSYGGSFPDGIWDDIGTRWMVAFRSACARPGCAISSELLDAQLGIELPARSSWPVAPSESSLRDDDGDGEPGVPFIASTPVPVPSSAFAFGAWAASRAAWQVELADTLMLALRFEGRLHGTLESCESASGTADELSLDARVLSCLLQSGEPCSADQTSSLNGNLPLYRITSASWRMVSVSVASCASARGALAE